MLEQGWLSACLVAGLVVLVLGSSIGVSYSVHVSRLKINELQETRDTNGDLKVEWGKLLLEQSTWGSYGRVEALAGEQLHMQVPEIKNMVIINE